MGVGTAMKICVFGLWHLGTVTAACLAKAGFRVVGLDFDQRNIGKLKNGSPPLFEPGLEAMIRAGIEQNRLMFTTDPHFALRDADVVWITYDTPVDSEDNANVAFVERNIYELFPYLPPETAVLISSQVPVGFTGRMEKNFARSYPDKSVTFAYSPENLRLGKAIEAFSSPGRIVVGTRREKDRERLLPLLTRLCNTVLWMSTESAEMTKHAINAFLATSVTFANEIALLCEKTGADAKEVELGLKSEERIGYKAYLSPGAAFAGGTLARDVAFLTGIGRATGQATFLLEAVQVSNDHHKNWPMRKILEIFVKLNGKKFAVLGLTYKPGTDTLRRSEAVELCKWLINQGAKVNSYDPAVTELPEELVNEMTLSTNVRLALNGADCVVVATEWPAFRDIPADLLCDCVNQPVVVDMKGFLHGQLGNDRRVSYFAAGRGTR